MNTLEQYIISGSFETLYTQLREAEGRIYKDEEVAQLPVISSSHVHYKEWLIRKRSSEKLIAYLKKKKRPLDILEIGCGNGWLSHRLSEIPGSKVIGTDINFTEIQQAARVFQHIPNLHFMFASLEPGIFKTEEFDCIIFAASIQYFESLKDTIQNVIPLLKPRGELHIIDSPFYPTQELLAAKQRSRHYYEMIGYPEMTEHYFHHSLDDLKSFHYKIRHNPESVFNMFTKNKNPFHWIGVPRLEDS